MEHSDYLTDELGTRSIQAICNGEPDGKLLQAAKNEILRLRAELFTIKMKEANNA